MGFVGMHKNLHFYLNLCLFDPGFDHLAIGLQHRTTIRRYYFKQQIFLVIKCGNLQCDEELLQILTNSATSFSN